MALPKRIVNVHKDGHFLRHAGQRFMLDERATAAKRGWVWVMERCDVRGATPSLLLYDAPERGNIIGCANPEKRWLNDSQMDPRDLETLRNS